MAHTSPTYVIFDGDNDAWAYRFMKGWKANEHVDFDFRDAHDLDSMTGRAQDEAYVKRNLRGRMEAASAVIVLVGEKPRWLYKSVRWELALALTLGLPIISVSLNNSRLIDTDFCPPIIRDKCVVNVPFKMKAIRHALDGWPSEFRNLTAIEREGGPRSYSTDTYKSFF